MKLEKQSVAWQSNSMGKFDKVKLKVNNFAIDMLLNYLGHNFSKEKLINLERSSLNHIISNQPVFLKDRILKAYYVLSKSLFINYEELLNHLAFARVGIYSGWLKGIKYSDLTSLIFLTTTGQLKFELNLLGREKLGLEKELISEVNILDRLRGEKAKSVFQKCKILI